MTRSNALWGLALLASSVAVAGAPVRYVANFALATVPQSALACDAPCVTPGLLTVNTEPWTQISVDGQRAGTTPLFQAKLLPGLHTVRFVNAEVGIDHVERWYISPAALTRVQGSFDAAGAMASNHLPEQQAVVPCGDCADALTSPAYLTVDAQPWGFVFVDGRRIGTTPLFRQRLGSGSHAVLVETADGSRRWSTDVHLSAGVELKLFSGERGTLQDL
jgi:hypothetical protein